MVELLSVKVKDLEDEIVAKDITIHQLAETVHTAKEKEIDSRSLEEEMKNDNGDKRLLCKIGELEAELEAVKLQEKIGTGIPSAM